MASLSEPLPESQAQTSTDQGYCLSSKFELTNVIVADRTGNNITKSPEGSQQVAQTTVTSTCEFSNYPIVIFLDLRNSTGVTEYYAFENLTINEKDVTTAGFSWTPGRTGEYQVTLGVYSCLACSGDFGNGKWLDFTVTQ